MVKRWNRFKTDKELSNRNIMDTLAYLREENDKIKVKNEDLLSLNSLVHESLQILIALGIQDEKDRLSLSLVGFKSKLGENSKNSTNKLSQSQNVSPKQSYIDLDKKCLSCSQNPQVSYLL